MNVAVPRISVVIPLYNKAASVSRAVGSVLAQDMPDFELLVIDDGSTDGSAECIAGITDSRLRIVRQANAGAAAARNVGIALAQAELIAFLDADDLWLPGFLSGVLGLHARFPHALAFATGYVVQNPGAPRRLAEFSRVPLAPEGGLIASWFEAIAAGANPVWSSAVALPRAVLMRLGGFPAGVRLYEDLHLWARVAIDGPIAYVPQALSVYCRDAENRACEVIVPTRDDLAFASVIERAIATGELAGAEAQAAQRVIDRYALLNAFKALVAGNVAEARHILRQAPRASWPARLRHAAIFALSCLPHTLVHAIWQAGRRYKAGRAQVSAA